MDTCNPKYQNNIYQVMGRQQITQNMMEYMIIHQEEYIQVYINYLIE